MSHIVTVKTKVTDIIAIRATCERLKIEAPAHGRAELFDGTATGTIVKLDGWIYPVVIDVATGDVRYDNFNGQWGEQSKLDGFLQRYAVEKARIEARKKGHNVSETAMVDGSIKLTITQFS